MKKLNMVGFLLMLVAVMLWASGCFTRAVAYTKTNPDGSKESRVSIVGTGDKTSQIAADGLFADGSAEDLGAGVKKAAASQQSTGIGETLTGIAKILEVMDRIKGGGGVAPAASVGKPAADTDAAIEAPVTTVAPELGPIVEPTYNTDGYTGVPSATGEGVYGRPSCGRCRAFKTAHPDVLIINLDNDTNRSAMWAALRARGFSGTSIQLPVSITADGYVQAAK